MWRRPLGPGSTSAVHNRALCAQRQQVRSGSMQRNQGSGAFPSVPSSPVGQGTGPSDGSVTGSEARNRPGEKYTTTEPPRLFSAVAIATKDRAEWLGRACESVFRDRPCATIVVVDASVGSDTESRCRELARVHPALTIHYQRAGRAGVSRQRNQAARFCDELGVEVVHFIDDDAELLPGYFEAIEARFEKEPDLAGVGGRQENPSRESHPWFNSFFLLSGRYPYTIRRSGRVVMPQPAESARRISGRRPVEWLQGFAMSYRISTLREHKFDEGLSFGEDRDLGFRISRRLRLAVEPGAGCLHHQAKENRLDGRKLGRNATVLTYAWVREQRSNGLSRLAFFWSAFGDVLRHVAIGVMGRGQIASESFAHALGIVDGLKVIASGRVDRLGAGGPEAR